MARLKRKLELPCSQQDGECEHTPKEAKLWSDERFEGATDAFSCKQFWHHETVKRLLGDLPPAHHDVPYLHLVNGLLDMDGYMRVDYKPNTSTPLGRAYGAPSYQNVTRLTRDICSREKYHDVDIVNCAPTLLLHVFNVHSLHSPFLTRLVQERDQTLDDISAFPVFAGDREKVKTAVIVTLFNGDYDYKSQFVPVAFLSSLKSEIVSNLTLLSQTSTYWGNLFDKSKQNANVGNTLFPRSDLSGCDLLRHDNVIGRFGAAVFQMLENKILRVLKSYCEDHGYEFGGSMFDGFHVEKATTPRSEDMLRLMENCVERVTGVRLALKVKEPDMRTYAEVLISSIARHETLQTQQVPLDVVEFSPTETRVKEIVWPLSSVAVLHRDGKLRTSAVIKDYKFPGTIDVSPTTKCLGISAGMCMGKSTQLALFVQTYTKSFKRILIVSPRIALTHEQDRIFSGLGFLHYHKLDHDNRSSDRMIITYNSVHRLADVDKYDLVIVDETRTVMDSMVDTVINNRHFCSNLDLFRFFIASSKLCIVTDADLLVDAVCSEFLLSVWTRSEITIWKYMHNYMHNRQFLYTEGEGDLLARVTEQVSNGKRCVLCCRVKKKAYQFLTSFGQQCTVGGNVEELKEEGKAQWTLTESKTDVRLLLITGDSPDELIQTLKHGTDVVNSYDLIVVTSKLAVGNDILSIVDEMFIDATGSGGCTPRTMLQMAGRFRHVLNNVIRVYRPVKHRKFATVRNLKSLKLAELKRDYIQSKALVSSVFRFYYDIQDAKRPVYVPDYLTNIKAMVSEEQRQNFDASFVRLCSIKNFTVSIETSIEVPVVVEVVEDQPHGSTEDTLLDVIKEVIRVTPARCLVSCNLKKGYNALTYRTRLLMDVSHKLKHWPPEFVETMDVDIARVAFENFDAIARTCLYSNWNSSDFEQKTVNIIRRSELYLEDAVKTGMKYHAEFQTLTNLCDALNMTSPFDFATEISTLALVENERQEEARVAIQSLRKARSNRCKAKLENPSRIIQAFKSEMKYYFGLDNTSRRFQTDNQRHMACKMWRSDQLEQLIKRADLYGEKPTGLVRDLDGKNVQLGTVPLLMGTPSELLSKRKDFILSRRVVGDKDIDIAIALVEHGLYHEFNCPPDLETVLLQ